MPIAAGLLTILNAFCAWHVYSTGRPKWWFAVIFVFPGVGAVAYLLFEILPGTRTGVQAQRKVNKAMDGIARAMDPEKELRRRIAELELNPSVDNRLALAQECMVSGMPGEAAKLYRLCLSGPFEKDPNIRFGLLNACVAAGEFGPAALEAETLLGSHGGYKTAEVKLLKARALEGQHAYDAAEGAFSEAIEIFSGEEARYRYAMMLTARGQKERARVVFEALLKNAERLPQYYRDAQEEWVKGAKRELAAEQA